MAFIKVGDQLVDEEVRMRLRVRPNDPNDRVQVNFEGGGSVYLEGRPMGDVADAVETARSNAAKGQADPPVV